MISFPLLGKYGRTGNQIFQFVATYYSARKAGTIAVFPESGHDLFWFNVENDVKFIDQKEMIINGVYRQNENDYSFDSNLLMLPDNTALVGYFQNIGYIEEFESDVRRLISFKENVGIESLSIISDLRDNSSQKLVAMHVRRGDYLGIQDVLPVCSTKYYSNAVERIESELGNNLKFIIFSDDIEWCRKNLQVSNSYYFDHEDVSTNLRAISMCDHHIIANSSFSWWGAWISNKGVVIRPSKWFGPAGPKNFDQMFPKGWISVDES
jgi:hypothetical protein